MMLPALALALYINTPAGDANERLTSFLTKVDLQMMWFPDDLAGVKVNGVECTCEPITALRLIVADTGLSVHILGYSTEGEPYVWLYGDRWSVPPNGNLADTLHDEDVAAPSDAKSQPQKTRGQILDPGRPVKDATEPSGARGGVGDDHLLQRAVPVGKGHDIL